MAITLVKAYCDTHLPGGIEQQRRNSPKEISFKQYLLAMGINRCAEQENAHEPQ
jgi:hypothetical protein